jgi:predicted  nucleic acid-binding Zn-ribbon protein
MGDKTEVSDYTNEELIQELKDRDYDFLDKLSDSDIKDEFEFRDLSVDNYKLEQTIDELEAELKDYKDKEDDILRLFYEYTQNKMSLEFEKELKKFFQKTINERFF